MPKIQYEAVKKELLRELDYINWIGTKTFLCPFMARSKIVIACYGFVYFLLLLTATQLIITLCLKDVRDWVEIVNVVPNLAVVLMTALKYNKVHVNQCIFKKIYEHFRDDMWDVISDSEQHNKIVARYTKILRYVTRLLSYDSIVLLTVVNSFPRLLMYLEEMLTDEEPQILYPFDGWYPFDKVRWYYSAYFWECFMTAAVIFIYLFVGVTNLSFTTFLCMELKILGTSIENLITPSDVTNLSKSLAVQEVTNINIKKKLKKIIKRHQFLAQITKEFDGVLGDQMLLSYVFGSVFVTLTLFTATVVDNLYKSLRYFSMFCSLMIEIFYQCMIGQVLSDHSADLSGSIYSADWPNADKDTKKMLLILMRRTQKPFQYTANGFLAMNLQSFSSICSMSYRFFNLLYTAYN